MWLDDVAKHYCRYHAKAEGFDAICGINSENMVFVIVAANPLTFATFPIFSCLLH